MINILRPVLSDRILDEFIASSRNSRPKPHSRWKKYIQNLDYGHAIKGTCKDCGSNEQWYHPANGVTVFCKNCLREYLWVHPETNPIWFGSTATLIEVTPPHTSVLAKRAIEDFLQEDYERTHFTYFTFVQGDLVQSDTSLFNVLRHLDFSGNDLLEVVTYRYEKWFNLPVIVATLTHFAGD